MSQQFPRGFSGPAAPTGGPTGPAAPTGSAPTPPPDGYTRVWGPQALHDRPQPDARFDAPVPNTEHARTTRSGVKPWMVAIPVVAVLAALGGGVVGAAVANPGAAPVQTRIVQSDGANPDWTQTAAAAAPSVVSIKVQLAQGQAEGSGVVLDTQGNIVTNNHVVAGAQQVLVTLSDQTVHQARVVGTDPSTDLAVIRVDGAGVDLRPIEFADSSTAQVGQPTMAIGNPLGLSETVTTGIVSALDRPVVTQVPTGGVADQQAAQAATSAIQTNAAINPGNSGGALVNADGQLLGITSSIASLSQGGGEAGNIGIGFAIPANEVKSVTDQLISDGTVRHAWLGVATQDATARANGATVIGAGVARVVPGSPADRAGIGEGDVITQLDGEPVSGSEDLMATIRTRPVGQDVTVTTNRDGQVRDLTVTLANAPS